MRRDPRWRFVPDDASFADSPLDLRSLTGHRLVTDFHLVDVAARHGLVLVTFDASFPRSVVPADRRHVALLPIG